jgi:Sigma 54 modulation protein / S30EA ribosomal protein
MKVVVSSDEYACCDEELIQRVEGVVEGALDRFGERIVRVDVHLSDLNSQNVGESDKICRLEARLAGHAPVIAGHEAPTLTEAIHCAADKLRRSLWRSIRELDRVRGAVPQQIDAPEFLRAPGTGGSRMAR